MSGLSWAVRGSFVRYVSALPDGRIRVAGGARRYERHIWFPESDAASVHVRRFSGSVAFTAHCGMLSVTIADPWLDWSSDQPVITIARPDGTRAPIAHCLVASDHVTRAWHGREVRLTEAGAQLFGGSYVVGELFDPFEVLCVPPVSDVVFLPVHRTADLIASTRL